MNKWMVAVIVMAVLGLPAAFVAGLAVAVSFEGGGSSAETLKTFLGSVGDWVSGLGALAAAVIAIYLADKQRRDSLPQIDVRQSVEAREIGINVVSVGDRSVHILDVYLRSRKLDGKARLVSSRDLPKTLEYGGILAITADSGRCGNFLNFISGSDDHCDLPDLEIVVEASTRTFIVPVDRELIDFIEGHPYIPDGFET